MSNTKLAVDAASALVALVLQALMANQRYSLLITSARTEGRDITDEELANLREENQALSDRLSEKLNPG